MKELLLRLNELAIFDPSRWPRRELVARLCGLSACTAFLIHRVFRFSRYTGDLPPALRGLLGMSEAAADQGLALGTADWHWIMWFVVWIIETGIFTGYILAFLTRREARSVARGFMEVVFPMAVAGLPVIITLFPMNFMAVWPPLMERLGRVSPGVLSTTIFSSWEPVFFFLLAVIIAGGAINLAGLLTLRRAFTIMSEARVFIDRGIFSLVRHPLYSGHFVMFFGYLMFHLYFSTCILYAAFLAGQYLRARIEENKLAAAFPEYARYRRDTGMFFPRIRRSS